MPGNPYTSEGSGNPKRQPEQITRNWFELLQELRVMQTGVQILTGFLLTVPFTERFTQLDDRQRWIYLGVLIGSVLTTLVLVAPVSFHRMLFRQRERDWLVLAAQVCSRAALIGLGVVSCGVLLLVFDVVVGLAPAIVVTSVVAGAFVLVWVGIPVMRQRSRST